MRKSFRTTRKVTQKLIQGISTWTHQRDTHTHTHTHKHTHTHTHTHRKTHTDIIEGAKFYEKSKLALHTYAEVIPNNNKSNTKTNTGDFNMDTSKTHRHTYTHTQTQTHTHTHTHRKTYTDIIERCKIL